MLQELHTQGRKYMSLYVGQTLDGQPTPVRANPSLSHIPSHAFDHARHQHQAPPPLPDNPRVTLEAAGGEVVAVLRFEGFITPETASAARDKLIACLQQGALLVVACRVPTCCDNGASCAEPGCCIDWATACVRES